MFRIRHRGQAPAVRGTVGASNRCSARTWNWHRMTGAPPVLDFSPLPLDGLEGWAMAGRGRFNSLGGDVVESEGGPGILWYAPEQFADFVLAVEWRVTAIEGNSGVFLGRKSQRLK